MVKWMDNFHGLLGNGILYIQIYLFLNQELQ